MNSSRVRDPGFDSSSSVETADCPTRLAPVVEKIERKDRDLAKQIRTAGSSIALNAGEGILGRKGHRDERLSTALCSAKETMLALRVAVAWGYVTPDEIAESYGRIDQSAAMLYRMRR